MKTCSWYAKHETGRLDERKWTEHLRTCALCQEAVSRDEKILSMARSLKEPVDTSTIWPRIVRECARGTALQYQPARPLWGYVRLGLAAVFILAVGIWALQSLRRDRFRDPLLSDRILADVEREERSYERAIDKLEKIGQARLPKIDRQLASLYQQRLQVIDRQIVRCREAIAQNPANTLIRNSFLAALREKKETLKAILELEETAS